MIVLRTCSLAAALNGIASAGRVRRRHYRALELGPVAVVSPIGATYAVVGVPLAVVFLGERPGPVALVGDARHGGRRDARLDRPPQSSGQGIRDVGRPGVPWALVSAVAFGIGGFLLGYFSQQVGWVTGLWASRMAQLIVLRSRSRLASGIASGAWAATAGC